MDYAEFLEANRTKLLGYFLVARLSGHSELLDTPYPPASLSGELLAELKWELEECVPLDSMISDLMDWDIQLHKCMSDDWYFEAAFGSASSVEGCATELTDFFIEKCAEYDIDYNQSPDDADFTALVEQQARNFITGWRSRIYTRYTQPGAPADAPQTARR